SSLVVSHPLCGWFLSLYSLESLACESFPFEPEMEKIIDYLTHTVRNESQNDRDSTSFATDFCTLLLRSGGSPILAVCKRLPTLHSYIASELLNIALATCMSSAAVIDERTSTTREPTSYQKRIVNEVIQLLHKDDKTSLIINFFE